MSRTGVEFDIKVFLHYKHFCERFIVGSEEMTYQIFSFQPLRFCNFPEVFIAGVIEDNMKFIL